MLCAYITFPQLNFKTFRGSGQAAHKWIKAMDEGGPKQTISVRIPNHFAV